MRRYEQKTQNRGTVNRIQVLQYSMQEKKAKTFIFERIQTQQSSIVEHQISQTADCVNLDALFQAQFPHKDSKISVYDPEKLQFEDISAVTNSQGQFPQRIFEPAFIFIRYSIKSPQTMDSETHRSSLMSIDVHQSEKEKRSKERTIGQVIQVVKRWRQLHLNGYITHGRHLNLQQAAKIVGISKKSLDDYYCQLRLGQLYHFDYLNNIQQKIGVLRNFVKNYRPEKNSPKRRTHDKHPKLLKILNYFDIERRQVINVDDLLKEEEYMMHKKPEPLMVEVTQVRDEAGEKQEIKDEAQAEAQDQPQSPLVDFIERPRHLFFLQEHFFNTFEIPLDKDADSYYQLEKDFRRRDMDFDDDSPMFGF